MKTKFEKQKEAYEKRMDKDGSVERQTWQIITKGKSWETGITFEDLKKEINKRRTERGKKELKTDNRIRIAISHHNKFGAETYGIYIQCDYGFVQIDENNKKREWRYFTPYEDGDFLKEEGKLEYIEDTAELKKNSLEYQKKIVIPQEQKLMEIGNGNSN